VKRIAVLGHAGMRNLGDEALLAAVIGNVRAREPAAEIICFSMRPEDSQQRHGVQSFPVRRRERGGAAAGGRPVRGGQVHAVLRRLKNGLKTMRWLRRPLARLAGVARTVAAWPGELAFLVASRRRLRGVDLLLVAGSQQLNDAYGGPWGFPYTLLKWSLLARSVGGRTAFLSVGAGPIRSRLSRIFLRCALSLASYRSFRDAASSELVRTELGVCEPGQVVPDLAFSLPRQTPLSGTERGAPTSVAANPVPFFDGRYWFAQDPAVYERYVRRFAAFSDWLVARGHSLSFFPTQLGADPPVIADIRRVMGGNGRGGGGQVVARPVTSLAEVLAEIGRADIVVASRFHGILFGLLLGKPVLAVAYHVKSRELMGQVGQEAYVVDADSLEQDALVGRFLALESRAEAIRRELEPRVVRLRDAVEQQYERVLRLVDAAAAGGGRGRRWSGTPEVGG